MAICLTEIFSLTETHHFNNIVQALEIHTVELSKVMIAMKNIITDSSNKKQLLTTKGTVLRIFSFA